MARLQDLQDNKKLRCAFRGMREAKFKLYSSLARLWHLRHLGVSGLTPSDYVATILKASSKKEYPLIKYYRQLGVQTNDWLILAFMQHYESPTPLIDFTHDFRTALFFMLQGITFTSKDGIDEYCSLVYFNGVDVCSSVSKLLTTYAEEKFPTIGLIGDDRAQKFKDQYLTYRAVTDELDTVIIPSYSKTTSFKIIDGISRSTAYLPVSNLNMVSQDGEFVCIKDASRSLEEQWIRDKKKYLRCINIHKSLCEYILHNILKTPNIDTARLKYFPNHHHIAKAISDFALSEAPKTSI